MPTRTQVIAATPRCPGRKLTNGHWKECGRALIWRHVHDCWACPTHGMVDLEPLAV